MATDPRKIPFLEITPDHISISDGRGEIVYWGVEEWTEDPSIVPAIANAIRLAFEGSTDALRNIIPPYPKGA